jgi:hypothetical protein
MELIQLDRAMFNKDFKYVPDVLPFTNVVETDSFSEQLVRFKAGIYGKIAKL